MRKHNYNFLNILKGTMANNDKINQPMSFNLKKKVDAKKFGAKFKSKREVYK